MPSDKLRFQIGDNAKLDRQLTTYATFSLPTGFSCPGARECLASADRKTGKITDGPSTSYRCFSASMESLRPQMRKSRWSNFDALVRAGKAGGAAMKDLIAEGVDALPKSIMIIRHGIGGDFFSQRYFDAWLDVMLERQNMLLYAYTKSLPYWVARINDLPDNFRLTASIGGRFDHLIKIHGLKTAEVFTHPDAAAWAGKEIDHDDSHAFMDTGGSFGLLLHGSQPKGSKASDAMKRMRDEKIAFSYATT
jgi:protein gp88